MECCCSTMPELVESKRGASHGEPWANGAFCWGGPGIGDRGGVSAPYARSQGWLPLSKGRLAVQKHSEASSGGYWHSRSESQILLALQVIKYLCREEIYKEKSLTPFEISDPPWKIWFLSPRWLTNQKWRPRMGPGEQFKIPGLFCISNVCLLVHIHYF